MYCSVLWLDLVQTCAFSAPSLAPEAEVGRLAEGPYADCTGA